MPALTIFSMVINYMRKHLMDALTNQIPNIKQSDIKFIVTVPAIWNDPSKQFMREAAVAVSSFDIIKSKYFPGRKLNILRL